MGDRLDETRHILDIISTDATIKTVEEAKLGILCDIAVSLARISDDIHKIHKNKK